MAVGFERHVFVKGITDAHDHSAFDLPFSAQAVDDAAQIVDGDQILALLARRMLRAFGDRADLRRHREALRGSGIAGTDTPFRFFWPTAVSETGLAL